MKLITWLKSCSGKALPLVPTIIGAAAVGVVGIAAYQMFSSPAVNPDTVFSSQDDDIVYVAGAAGGEGSRYQFVNGEAQSSINVKQSRSMELMNYDAARTQEKPQTQLDRDEEQVKAFKMDGAFNGGLGMGKNEVNEFNNGGNGDMSGIQAQIAAVAAMADQKKAEAQAEGAGDIAAAAQAAALKQGGKWDSKAQGMAINMNSSIARASGNNLKSNPLQGDGAPGSLRGGTLGGVNGKEADRLAMANRTVGFNSSRDEILNARRRYQGGDDLTAMAKQSASYTKGEHGTNEATTSVFMSSSSKGVMELDIGGNAASSLGATESDDFTGASVPDLSGYGVDAASYAQAKEDLMKKLEKMREKANWISNFIPVLGSVIVYLACKGIYDDIDAFNAQWKDTEMEKNNSKGSFGSNAKDLADRIIAGSLFFGGAEWAWQANKGVLYDEIEPSDENK